MAKKEEKKPQTLSDYMDELRKSKIDNLDDVFEKYDAHMDEDHQKHLLVNVFGAGIDEFYNNLVEGLKEVGDDKTSLKGKEEEVKKAALKGMKAYLKKIDPSGLKNLLKHAKDEKEEYKLLCKYVNEMAPLLTEKNGKPIDIEKFIDDYVKDKKHKVIDLKQHFYITKGQTSMHQRGRLNGMYEQHLFGTYKGTDLVAHMKPRIEKKFTIEDMVDLMKVEVGDALKLHRHMKYGENIENIEQYGLASKEEGKGE